MSRATLAKLLAVMRGEPLAKPVSGSRADSRSCERGDVAAFARTRIGAAANPWGKGVAGILTTLLFSGCSATGPAAPTDRYMVTVPQSQFYKYGPAQAFGADGVLTQGQRVRMLSREFGFSRVLLENGQSGYVSTDDVKPAPPDPPPPRATPTPKPRGPVLSGGRKRNPVEPRSVSAPLFDLSDVPAPPLPKEPEKPALKPGFRY